MTILLDKLLAAFLERQELQDCRIVFEPPRAGARRAKRSNARIKDALDPMSQAKVQDGRTVQDLLDRLLMLSGELKAWTQGPSRRYVARLYHEDGTEFPPGEFLSKVRGHAQVRDKRATERVQRALNNALRACDRLLDPSQVNDLAIRLIADRKGR